MNYVFSDDEDSNDDAVESSYVELEPEDFPHPDVDYQSLLEAEILLVKEPAFLNRAVKHELWMWTDRDVEESLDWTEMVNDEFHRLLGELHSEEFV